MGALAAGAHETRGILVERGHVVVCGSEVEEDVGVGRGDVGCPSGRRVGVCGGEGSVDGADVVNGSGHG